MDEMNITYFSSSLSQTFFLAWRWKMLFLHCVLQCFMFFSVWNGLINRSSIFIAEELDVCPCWNRKILHLPWMINNNGTCNVATSSRIQHHPTHFTWRYYTPPTPPICIQERPFWYSIKTEGSSKLRGTPSLEPIYIYISTHTLFAYAYIHLCQDYSFSRWCQLCCFYVASSRQQRDTCMTEITKMVDAKEVT